MSVNLVCPVCSAEYRAGIDRCAKCSVDLVSPNETQASAKGRMAPQEALKGKETIVVPQVNLSSCRELEKLILAAGYPCYTQSTEADADVALGSSASMMYGVVVAAADVDAIRTHLKGSLEATLAKQGLGSLQTEAIVVDSGSAKCPACGHEGPLVEGACGDCGLFLGAA
jgi:transposase-like protein